MVRKLGVMLLGAFLVCAGSVDNALAAEKILKVGVGDAIDSGAGVFSLKFKELVEAKTNGAVEVTDLPQLFAG